METRLFPRCIGKRYLLSKLPLRDGNGNGLHGLNTLRRPFETSSEGWKPQLTREEARAIYLSKLPLRDGNWQRAGLRRRAGLLSKLPLRDGNWDGPDGRTTVQRPSETSLEGWKQVFGEVFEAMAKASETSLEGWKLGQVFRFAIAADLLPKLP